MMDIPFVRQETDYSCGPACLRAVCKYFKVSRHAEKEYIKRLSTDEYGTTPSDIVRVAKGFGLSARMKTNMTLQSLQRCLDKGRPVICAIQGCRGRACGHYVVAVGYDDYNVYFMDSLYESHVILKNETFLRRWHDMDKYGNEYNQLGIAIWCQPT